MKSNYIAKYFIFVDLLQRYEIRSISTWYFISNFDARLHDVELNNAYGDIQIIKMHFLHANYYSSKHIFTNLTFFIQIVRTCYNLHIETIYFQDRQFKSMNNITFKRSVQMSIAMSTLYKYFLLTNAYLNLLPS